MEKHVNIVAALNIGLSILGLLVTFFICIVLKVVGGIVDDAGVTMILSIIANVLSVFLIILFLPGIIAGIGLFRKREWARILALILSAVNLINFPIGTVVGAYSIWVLVQPETVALFKDTTVAE